MRIYDGRNLLYRDWADVHRRRLGSASADADETTRSSLRQAAQTASLDAADAVAHGAAADVVSDEVIDDV